MGMSLGVSACARHRFRVHVQTAKAVRQILDTLTSVRFRRRLTMRFMERTFRQKLLEAQMLRSFMQDKVGCERTLSRVRAHQDYARGRERERSRHHHEARAAT
jgi:hypothetical protein